MWDRYYSPHIISQIELLVRKRLLAKLLAVDLGLRIDSFTDCKFGRLVGMAVLEEH